MKKMKRQITIVIILGMILMAADMIASSDNQVKVEESYEQLYLIRPEVGEDGSQLTLTAKISGENGIYEERVNITLDPYEKKKDNEEESAGGEDIIVMTEEERLKHSLRSVADDINADSSVKKVSLPAKLETGEKIVWEMDDSPKSNTFAIAGMMFIVCIVIYRERDSAAKKKAADDRESVLMQLPGFINRLVLLLNAGLVLNNAFERAVEESVGYGKEEEDFFRDNLKSICTSIKTANGSLGKGLKNFARKSGVQELMRISNIINDNISKGTELTYKLQSESEILWMNRKKRCEELGRVAETKLTLPLVLFLMVLVVITIAPALLEL